MIFHTDFNKVDSFIFILALFRAERRLNFNWSANDGVFFFRFVDGTIKMYALIS